MGPHRASRAADDGRGAGYAGADGPAETGAVTLALPQDVQAEAYDYPAAFFEKKVHYIDRRPPAADAVKRAAELIAGSKRPLIVSGGGTLYSSAERELTEFAEAFGIPVAETQAGKSALPWGHRLNVGAVGVTGSLAANLLAKEADLIIGVGTRYSDFTTASKSAFANPGVRFVNINISGFDSAKLNGEPLPRMPKKRSAHLGKRCHHRIIEADTKRRRCVGSRSSGTGRWTAYTAWSTAKDWPRRGRSA